MIKDYEEVKDNVTKLKALLDDPQFGNITWLGFFCDRMDYLTEYWKYDNKETNGDC